MFDRFRKALHLPGGPNAARPVSNQEVVRWAATQRLAVVPQAVDGHFDLGGDLNGHPWRLECGNPTRDYVRGLELRGRADLGVDPDAAVMVLNRPLQESLEGNAYNAITDTLQTTVNASLPEEMRWLAMFEEVTWPGLPASFRRHFAVVAERIDRTALDPCAGGLPVAQYRGRRGWGGAGAVAAAVDAGARQGVPAHGAHAAQPDGDRPGHAIAAGGCPGGIAQHAAACGRRRADGRR